jgi:hypothetical protein
LCQADRSKRDILDPFTSFYLSKNKEANRNKREDQDDGAAASDRFHP